jgi:hypothetical protein
VPQEPQLVLLSSESTQAPLQAIDPAAQPGAPPPPPAPPLNASGGVPAEISPLPQLSGSTRRQAKSANNPDLIAVNICFRGPFQFPFGPASALARPEDGIRSTSSGPLPESPINNRLE